MSDAQRTLALLGSLKGNVDALLKARTDAPARARLETEGAAQLMELRTEEDVLVGGGGAGGVGVGGEGAARGGGRRAEGAQDREDAGAREIADLHWRAPPASSRRGW